MSIKEERNAPLARAIDVLIAAHRVVAGDVVVGIPADDAGARASLAEAWIPLARVARALSTGSADPGNVGCRVGGAARLSRLQTHNGLCRNKTLSSKIGIGATYVIANWRNGEGDSQEGERYKDPNHF